VETPQWSEAQREIFDWFEGARMGTDYENLVVRARAGTGKTTTIVEGVNRAPEESILVCAFNKGIADTLNQKIQNPRAEAKTLHGVGMRAIGRMWRGLRVAKPTSARTDFLTDQVVPNGTPYQMKKLVSLLHTKGREMCPTDPTADAVLKLALFFNLEPSEGWAPKFTVDHIVAWAVAAMKYAKENPPRYEVGIDFADMIYLPLAWDLLTKDYQLVVVDEAQDMSKAQLEIVRRVCDGRLCIVGDDRQCQPAGTMVRSSVSGNVPIESLQAGDTIESFDRHGQVFIKAGRVTQVAFRPYTGQMIRVMAGGHSTQCTPNHKWLVRWTNKANRAWVTYLMRQGTRYRVGQCQLFRQENATFGVSQRARVERADAAWILEVHDTLQGALACEQIMSARYGIPEMVFHPPSHIRYFTKEVIDMVYEAFEPGELHDKALRCLADHNRDIDFPIYTKAAEYQRRGRTTLFETQACNLLTGYMAIATAPETITGHDKKDRHAVAWVPVTIRREHFEGLVYSLNIDKYHKYVADGLVTCNCIYSFRGADTGSLDRLKKELSALELPLTTTYRCGQSIVERAKLLVSDFEAGPANPVGIVEDVEDSDLMALVQPGDFVLSRLNAPLVSLTLHLLRSGVRARMAGRDIGAGILSILKRLKIESHTPIGPALNLIDAWERKMTTRYASFGELQLVDQTRDQADMLRALMEDADSMKDVVANCTYLFTDDPDASQVVCSSVHKAKGLEANRVFVLWDSLYRRGPSQEEDNICYVATTRAISYLGIVRGTPSLQRRTV